MLKFVVFKIFLYLVVENDKLEVVYFLVCQGVNILVQDKGGWCFIEYVIMRGYIDMFEFFFQDIGYIRYIGVLL